MNKIIEATIKDLVSDFLYYDRKEDESLPMGEIEKEIENGNLSVSDIVNVFECELKKNL